LTAIDQALGSGVATPDHVLYITPGAGGCCPATEPEEPDDDAVYPAPAHADSRAGQDVLVAVVDTGWLPEAAEHARTPWLAGVTGDVETYDPKSIRHYVGHGTFVAGVVRCLAPNADVRVEGFLPKGGAVFESELIAQLNDSLNDAPDIITMSAGTSTRNDQDLLGFRVFYETRLSQLKGTVLVAAAGNDAGRGPFWPAAFPWAISVGALDAKGDRASFSNFGSWVDVYAPGVDLVNAYASGKYTTTEPPHVGEKRRFDGLARWSGTSFSTPYVAGLIAARMSETGENARQAADALLAIGRKNAKPGVGARLMPGVDLL
jgi:subtilisin family serine protease